MILDGKKFIEKGKLKTKKFKINIRIFNKVLFAIIIALFVYYIAGANDLTVKGFKLQELKKISKELGEQNNNLELQAMALGAYNNLGEKISALNMVAVGKVEYISALDALVAKK
jgi:hypothetical protein